MRRIQRFQTVALLSAVMTIISASATFADNLEADGDDASTSSTTLAFDEVCIGATAVGDVSIFAKRNGSYPGPQVYANSAPITVTRGTLTGTGLSAPSGTVGTISLPSTWSTAANNTPSDAVATTVSYTPTTTASLSGASIGYSGSGAGSNVGTTVTRSASIAITGKGKTCDTTAPVIVPSVDGTVGNNDWYTSDVTISWSVTDPESAISSSTDCDTTVLSTDSTGETYTCSATSAGGTSSSSVSVKRDATAPTGISVSADRSPDSNGWYNAMFTASWSGTDATSGIASCTETTYSGPDTGAGSLSGTCTDEAGNAGPDAAFGFMFDASGPTVIGTPDRAPDHNGWYNHAVTVTWSVSSDLSGQGVCDAPTTYSGPSDGAVTLTGSCTDAAGNPGNGAFGAFMYDDTAPAAAIAADRAPDHDGWYNASFTGATSGTDEAGGSGIDSCTAPQLYDGPDTAVGGLSGSCTDVAGNASDVEALSFMYDATAPSAAIAADRAPDHNGWYTSALTATTTGSDATSGIASCTPDQPYGGPDGANRSLDGTCTDNAGNASLPATLVFNYDATAPSIALVARTAANANGWNNGTVDLEWSCTDATSTPVSPSVAASVATEGADQSATGTCEDLAGNTASDTQGDIDIDLTDPAIVFDSRTPANGNGWNNGDVTVNWTCTDGLSGPADATISEIVSAEGADQSATGTCEDLAGNTASDTQGDIDIDLTDPTDVTFVGGIDDGDSFYFGSVPAAPTCTALDALSGYDGCSVTGYSALVGTHELTATALDKAGNDAVATLGYQVNAWTLLGFYSPVDMGGVWNSVKSGSTVPLKFEVFAGPSELTDTAIISTLAKQVTCNALPEDTVELTATGSTSLRYSDGQFIFNWQTPSKRAGSCWKVRVTTQDGSFIEALFKLK